MIGTCYPPCAICDWLAAIEAGELRRLGQGAHTVTGAYRAGCTAVGVDVEMIAQDDVGEVVAVDDPAAVDWFCRECGDLVVTR